MDILEEDGALFVNIKIENLQDYNFPPKAKIYLEAYDSLDMDHIDLGDIGSFESRARKKLSSFNASRRKKINFRLKVTDTKTWRLLGLAERLKEGKYAHSFLPIETDSKINTVFKIDWSHRAQPVLLVSQKLTKSLKDIKPVLAEAVLREILLNLLLDKDFDDDLEDHQWIKFAGKHKDLPDNLEEWGNEDKREWIDKVVDEFSKKRKTIANLKKRLEKD